MADLRTRVENIRSLQRDLGIDYSHLWHVLRGQTQPSVRLAQRIELATQGAIRWQEFFDHQLALEVAAAGPFQPERPHGDLAPDAGPGVLVLPHPEPKKQRHPASSKGAA